MKTKYLTYAQAYAIASDFQYLIGEPYDNEYPIDQILVVPYSQGLQWPYVAALLGGAKPAAPKDETDEARYDVVIVSKRAASPTGFLLKDLRTHLEQTGVFFNGPKYVSPINGRKVRQRLLGALHGHTVSNYTR